MYQSLNTFDKPLGTNKQETGIIYKNKYTNEQNLTSIQKWNESEMASYAEKGSYC